MSAANAVYEVWAKYRTQLTGREELGVLLQRRKLEEAEGASCRVGAGAGAACDEQGKGQ